MHAKTDDAIRHVFPTAPEFGVVTAIAPGLDWLRLPLPFKLNHVNLWLLDDGDGWTIIDTGADTPEARAMWTAAFAGPLSEKPLNRLIATHGHPDHIGLASWLLEARGAAFVCTLTEWLQPQIWHAARIGKPQPAWKQFFVDHGCPDTTLATFAKAQDSDFKPMGPIPASFERIRDGDRLQFGSRTWEVIVGAGHADEHASFWCADDAILIAGDQILSRITPVVGVFPSEPLADPLTHYLASLKRFRKLPDETLVLPSHGLPFHGLHTRIDQIERHHAERLDTLLALIAKPITAYAAAQGLFADAMAGGHEMLALAETLAHLNHLVRLGDAQRATRDDGQISFAAPKRRRRSGANAGKAKSDRAPRAPRGSNVEG